MTTPVRIVAQYSGVCGECGTTIRPGQHVERFPGDAYGWHHITCPPEPTACPKCWLVASVSGTCGCDEAS